MLLGASTGGALAAPQFVSLYSFCPGGGQCVDGAFPVTGLSLDSRGNLFGVTSSGGTSSAGEIFELVRSKSAYTFQPLHSLGSGEGQDLVTPLVVDVNGNLYGTAEAGGAHGAGTAFELSPDVTGTVWTFHVLYNFCNQGGSACTDGMTPLSRLTYAGASDGALYDGTSPLFGTTESGGNNSGGTVFRLTLSGGQWSEKVLYHFCPVPGCQDGEAPEGDLAIDSAGTLYGTASAGGVNSQGVLYRLDTNTNIQTVLHRFCKTLQCPDGADPFAGVDFAIPGILIGTTKDGGKNGKGIAYSYEIGGKQGIIYPFCNEPNCTDGFNPAGPPIFFDNKFIIGVVHGAGDSFGTGIVYAIHGRKKEKQLHIFCLQLGCVDGTNPQGGLVAFRNHVFGTTQSGGKFGSGTVYEIRP